VTSKRGPAADRTLSSRKLLPTATIGHFLSFDVDTSGQYDSHKPSSRSAGTAPTGQSTGPAVIRTRRLDKIWPGISGKQEGIMSSRR
jgi:hypothetical protein